MLSMLFGERRSVARHDPAAVEIERRQARIAANLGRATHRPARLILIEAYRRADERIAER